MKENAVKKKLVQRQPVAGVISPSPDPGFAELIGLLGFDFYMVDGEHAALGPSEVLNIVRACEAVGVTALARVRSVEPKLLLQFMDTGVMGVMMPGIKNADDVQKLVAAVKYPPLGERGLGPIRAADFFLGPMSQAEYVSFANDQTIVLPQIEDIEAVEHLDEMLQVEGVDGLIVGPRDLAMSMGFPDGPNHDEVQAVIEDIYETVLASDLVLGTVAGTGEAAKALVERGLLICLNSVNGLIKSAAVPYLETMKG